MGISTITLNKDIKNTCSNCLYAATHEKCDGCLGTPEQVKKNNGIYLYGNWAEGDGIARILEWEKQGETNIVIGGVGGAEVNTKWTPEHALESLVNVSEQCGYMTTKGKWYPEHKEIYICTDDQYRLTYWNDKLDSIDRIREVRVWAT